MGLGIYSALGNFSSVFYFKLGVGILGIIVGLANLKDYFWYGKWFVMEVPFSWRKNMRKLLNSVTSPMGAFLVGFLVSLFLLPCTSGPYLVILGYLSSENKSIDNWGYLYLFIYNLFFILPMLIITFIVAFGKKSIEELELYRDDKIETIHLWVGGLMLLLGGYVILQAFGLIP
ncbi:MAG: cytochrome c biogenesis protein CcdA, partial [Candidatus Gracilibacteria bacterium]|nr:cytochrome c biogenesis protein CcdA [Candidatus Gracilibacteria bacterium]